MQEPAAGVGCAVMYSRWESQWRITQTVQPAVGMFHRQHTVHVFRHERLSTIVREVWRPSGVIICLKWCSHTSHSPIHSWEQHCKLRGMASWPSQLQFFAVAAKRACYTSNMSKSERFLERQMPIDNHVSFQSGSLEVKLCATAQRGK